MQNNLRTANFRIITDKAKCSFRSDAEAHHWVAPSAEKYLSLDSKLLYSLRSARTSEYPGLWRGLA